MGSAAKKVTSEQRVLIFAAQSPRVENRQIYFLFSQRQMEDILMETAVRPVPLSPAYTEGVAEWRDRMLPVVSLEACLGMKPLNSSKIQRVMVVGIPKIEEGTTKIYNIMLRAVPPIRLLTLPIPCTPVSDDCISHKRYVRAVYEWEDGLLVVANMAKILSEESENRWLCNGSENQSH